ncbi:MAG: PQQ-binding-like beta-propeller repeat protein [Planctomycetota bacterium]
MIPRLRIPLVLTTLLCASCLCAADWPQWRGPNRDGKSLDTGLLKKWPAGGPKLLWHVQGIGRGYSSVAVAQATVYTTGLIEDQLVISAFDMNGKTKWRVPHGPGWTEEHPGSRATPTIDEGRLYLLSGPGLLACYNARTGERAWSIDLPETFQSQPGKWGYAESVLIHKNLAIVTPGRPNCIVALDKRNGRTVWRSRGVHDPAAYSSCIAFTHQGVDMIVNLTAHGLVCVGADDGQFLWRNDRAAALPAGCPTPVYSDGYVFAASGYGNGGVCLRLSVAGRSVRATQVWETREMDCHHGGFVIVDGCIYGNHGRGWNCLDLHTGRQRWFARGVGKGSICYADGMLYTYSEIGGRIALVAASPKGFSEVSNFAVQGRGQSFAHPVVAGGTLYLRYDDNLYAYDVRGPAFPH